MDLSGEGEDADDDDGEGLQQHRSHLQLFNCHLGVGMASEHIPAEWSTATTVRSMSICAATDN
jgi:hypothetical protein